MDIISIKYTIVSYFTLRDKITFHYTSKNNYKYLIKDIISNNIRQYFELVKLFNPKKRPLHNRLDCIEILKHFYKKNNCIFKYQTYNNSFKILQESLDYSYYLANSIIALDTFNFMSGGKNSDKNITYYQTGIQHISMCEIKMVNFHLKVLDFKKDYEILLEKNIIIKNQIKHTKKKFSKVLNQLTNTIREKKLTESMCFLINKGYAND